MDATETFDAILGPPAGQPSTPRPLPANATPPVVAFAFDACIGLVLMLAFSLLVAMGWGIALGGDGTGDLALPFDAMALLWMSALGTGGAALVMYAWRRPAAPAERAASMAAARRPSTWGWAVLVALVVFLAATAVRWSMARAGIEAEPGNLQFVEDGLASHPVYLLLFAVVLAPAYEELLFRRVLFGRLWSAGKPWLGIVLSSVVFALMHEVPGLGGNPVGATAVLWLLYAAMGAAFAWLYWRTGTLWAPIGAHALNNLAACVVLLATA